MSVFAIIVAVVLALIAFRFVKGVIKIGCLALIAVVLIWFFANGVAH
jgi:plastocyanin domain-containing protein